MSNLKDAGAKFVNNIADDAEIVRKVYDDGLSPTVKETGKAMSFPAQILNALFVKKRIWAINKEYEYKETEALLLNKLKYIEENKLVEPPDFVFVPALQGLCYSIDDSNLRELYANLLASAMNSDTSAMAHPAYIEIIKQFSPLDAKLFKHLAVESEKHGKFFLLNIKFNSEEKVVREYSNIVDFQSETLSDISQSITNLIRCGLIAVSNECFVPNKIGIDEIRQWENVKKECLDGTIPTYDSSTAAKLTEFGKRFYYVCCEE